MKIILEEINEFTSTVVSTSVDGGGQVYSTLRNVIWRKGHVSWSETEGQISSTLEIFLPHYGNLVGAVKTIIATGDGHRSWLHQPK